MATKKKAKRVAKKTPKTKTTQRTQTSDEAAESATTTTAAPKRARKKRSTRNPAAETAAHAGVGAATEAENSGDAQVSEAGGAVVIRFPPVAPPPFTMEALNLKPEDVAPFRGEAGAEAAPANGDAWTPRLISSPDESDGQGERGDRGDRRGRRGGRRGRDDRRGRRGDRGSRGGFEAEQMDGDAAAVAEAPPRQTRDNDRARGDRDDSDEQLSRSQRRRMRRRRRHGDREDETSSAARTEDRTPSDELLEEALDLDREPKMYAGAEDDDAGVAIDEPPELAASFADGEESDDYDDDYDGDEDVAVLDEAQAVDDEDVDDDAEDGSESTAVAEDDESEGDDEDDEDGEAGGQRRGRRRRSRRRRGDRRGEPSTAAARPDAVDATQEMIINFVPRDECRIAILENGRLGEINLERASYENHVGSIYKGVVTNVEPSIQAAFVDFGLGKNGFLHITDLNPDYFPAAERNVIENVGRKMPRRNRPPIQKCLRRGQEVVVQITKEGIGTKGPTLSTYLSIPGRFVVMMPGMRRLGISRKIEDENLRDDLRDAMKSLELPENMGFIARTAAGGRSRPELEADLSYLSRLWNAVQRRAKNERAPCEIYRESDLVIRTIRDVYSPAIKRIVVDDPEVAERAREFLALFSPEAAELVVDYTDPEPIFHKYGVEAELERLHSRRVPLPSGGSLVIDSTEALVAIDVNSGRFRTEDDAESTAFKINQEAADEIARQLRLRDLGGVVVCDFIDMRLDKHKREIERRLANHLRQHKERAKVLRFSQFGLIELTRQRRRASLTRNVYQDCQHCRGTGLVKTLESVVIDVMRLVQLAATRDHVYQIEVTLSADVANQLQNRKRSMLYELETRHRRLITIKPDSNYTQDQVNITCYDQRGRPVPHT